jgi:integrase
MMTGTPRRPRGAGSITPWHKGGYRGRMSVPGTGKVVTVYGATYDQVEAKLGRLKLAKAAGTLTTTPASLPTVKDWLEAVYTEHANPPAPGVRPPWKTSTANGYRSVIDANLVPALGHLRIDRVTAAHVDALYTVMRAKGHKEGTLIQAQAVLRKALNVAIRRNLLTGANPVTMAEHPPKTNQAKRTKGLTLKQALRVLEVAGDRPRWWLALMLGMRQGECLALRWYDLHLDAIDEDGNPAPYLVVRESVTPVRGGGRAYDKPKSAAGTDREVPLPAPVATRLAKALAEHLAAGGALDGLVVTNRKGTALDKRKDYATWQAILDVAGVPYVQLRGARNTTGKLLVHAGVPLHLIAQILGHADIAMTAHYVDDDMAGKTNAMRMLDAHMGHTVPNPDPTPDPEPFTGLRVIRGGGAA